jgi:hypothetical protein
MAARIAHDVLFLLMQFAISRAEAGILPLLRCLKIDLRKDTEVGQRQHLRAKDA